jgi:DNA repair protein RadC
MTKNTELKVIYSSKKLSQPISCSGQAFAYFIRIWDKSLINVQEQVYILYLNGDNEVICWRLLNTGTSSTTLFDLKLALACALNCLASKIIIAHNHPSGLLKASKDDINVTRKLKTAASFMDIELLDHIIINDKSYCSFADQQLLTA